MSKGYPIVKCIPGIPITDQANHEHQTEENEIASTYENKEDYEITKNGEKEKNIE